MHAEKESEKAKAYNRAKRILLLAELGLGFLYLAALLFSGASVVLT
ncbi:MAG: hypothetical protein HY801_08485, partial [Candidatus Lindowbacteria bacterium]|nr:hypothetical protein [Candidatus Lindowbacteria bacterium]